MTPGWACGRWTTSKLLVAFFEARRGQLYGFRWKDWADFKSCAASQAPEFTDQVIGDRRRGDDAVSRWSKTYASGIGAYQRPIVKPVTGTVTVGVAAREAAGGGALADGRDTTGMVSFDVPPASGVEVTAGFEFDVPVRFDIDRIQTSVASFRAGDVPTVPVMEVRV